MANNLTELHKSHQEMFPCDETVPVPRCRLAEALTVVGAYVSVMELRKDAFKDEMKDDWNEMSAYLLALEQELLRIAETR